MKKIVVFCLIALLTMPLWAQKGGQMGRLEEHLYFLASDSLQGRKAGTPYARKAAQYIAQQYETMGVAPLYDRYLIPFSLETNASFESISNLLNTNADFQNVAVVIPGSDPALRHEYIIIGAHYDHLGVKNGMVYNGADDNASGTAAVIEVARRLKSRQQELKRSVIIANFDAEEIGLYGSDALAHNLAQSVTPINAPALFKEMSDVLVRPLDYCKLMMSVDMVGWLRQSGHLDLTGYGTFSPGNKVLEDVAKQCDIPVRTYRYETSIFTATDTRPFAVENVPTLAVTTGTKSPYHKPQDDADLVDYEGLNAVVNYLTELAVVLCGEEHFETSGHVASIHQNKLKPVQVGVTAGLGSNMIQFKDGAIQTHSKTGVDAGLSLTFNIDKGGKKSNHCFTSLQLNVLYDMTMSTFPDQTLPFSSHFQYRQHGFKVPLSYRLNFYIEGLSFFVGAGGYYSRLFEASLSNSSDFSFEPSQWGLLYEVGYMAGRLELKVGSQYQLNNLLTGSMNYNSRLLQGRYQLSWYF